MKTIQVQKEQLKTKIGNNQYSLGQNVRTQEDIAEELGVDAWGCIPVRIATELTQEQFDKLLEG